MKNKKYKHLSEEMISILDNEIKLFGKNKTYDKVAYNINVSTFSKLQSDFNAFKNYAYNKPVILDPHSSMEQEMLYYIDKDRYNSGDVPNF